jgi:hypothetical protein
MQATARRLSVVSATSCARRRLIQDVRPRHLATHMHGDTEIEERSWRPPEPIPSTSPRTLAIILLCGGLLIGGFDAWRRMSGFPFVPIPLLGYLVVAIWLVRSLDMGRSFSIAGWWISVLWHVLLLVSTILLLPVALALASRASVLFLLPHVWVVAALVMSIKGLRAETQLHRSSLPNDPSPPDEL